MQFVNGWVDTASEYNIMQNSMSRQGYQPTHVVLHGTAGGSYAKDVAAYEATHQVSTHFIIGIDGEICQEVDCNVAAWGNAPLMSPRLAFDNADANPNYWTISIEFCKPDGTNQITITDAQLASGIALVKLICETYGIPKKRGDGHGGIIGHCDINSVTRAMCPGTFPWDALIAGINVGTTPQPSQGGTTMSVPQGWKDANNVLTAPNGITVTAGFRDYVLAHNWDAGNLPLETAQGLNPLELSNPGLGGGTRQIFRWTTLEWTSTHGVFESWSGQELLTTINLLHDVQSKYQALGDAWNKVVPEKDGLIAQVAQLNAKIAALEAQPGNVAQLQQQISQLTQQVQAQSAQLTTLSNKLMQINTISKVGA